MRTRTSVLTAAMAAVALVSTACGSSDGGGSTGVSESTIKIGITNALSGPGGSVCAPFTEASSAYFDMVNDNGGVAGHQIDYQVLDDAYDATRAVANMRELMSEDMFAFVGGCGTIQAAPLAPALTKSKIPYLFPYAGLRELVDPVSPYVYGLLPLYEDQIKALVPYVFEEKGAGSVYMAANEWPGYEDAIDNAKAATEQGGGTFLDSQVTKLGTADYTPVALAIKDAQPDYLIIDQGGADAVKLVDALVAQGALPKKGILGVSTLTTGVFLESHNTAADPLLHIASPVRLPAEPDSACAKALDAAGLAQDGATVFGCAQAELFVRAVEEADDLTRDGLVKALDQMTVEETAVLPEVAFTEDDHMGVDSVYVQTLDRRKLTTVATSPIE
jgi:branched-chain amino acid transport system substrate-binding protein